ncbi:MAG TPA: ribonuclease H-like domain-containing protein [Candidatus Limnocylindria bacterium]|nr:ribonuclease H-like domain-containing protein [Candidatus Limnocylindria bacterium]
MLPARSLADRLAAVRGRPAPVVTRRAADDRVARLARWFDARTEVCEHGRALVVERRVPLPDAVLGTLRSRSRAGYFDTETTGLSTGSGTVIFLAGVATLEGDRMLVRQFLLPDYPYERALLRSLMAALGAVARVVTYNGRAFDLPMLTTRLTVNGLFGEHARLPALHDDLLPDARRLFRRALGGARLADIEAGVLGVRRASDCPGSEVPARYFNYLGGGSPDVLGEVLDHNLQDVVSLALLEAELCRLRAGGWREADVLDPHGMALDLLRAGRTDDAAELLEEAVGASDGRGDAAEGRRLRRLAGRLLLAAGEVDRAEAMWRAATRRASVEAAAAWVEVARIRERRRGDLRGAMDAAAAASRVLDLAFALGRGGSIDELARMRVVVEGRLRRLRRWVAASERRAGADGRRVA